MDENVAKKDNLDMMALRSLVRCEKAAAIGSPNIWTRFQYTGVRCFFSLAEILRAISLNMFSGRTGDLNKRGTSSMG